MFLCRIRFGWETEPTGLGAALVIFSKIDTYGAVRKPLKNLSFR